MGNINEQDNIKIRKVFENYFDILDSFFGGIKHHLSNDSDSHILLGEKMAEYPLISDLVLDATEELAEALISFWNTNGYRIIKYLSKHDGLKCLYSGDLSPVNLESFTKRTALYVDTIVLPDPTYNLAVLSKPIFNDKRFYLEKLIRHVFNIWRMKNIILAKAHYQIIVLYPVSIRSLPESQKDELMGNAKTKSLDYISKLFDRDFSEIEEVESFLKQDDSLDVFKSIKEKTILPNAFKTKDGFEREIARLQYVQQKSIMRDQGLKPGGFFARYITGQFIRTEEHQFFCEKFNAQPIYDYELPWFFYNYEHGTQDIDPAIINALQKQELEWIGNVDLEAISILREEGRIEYMRDVMRHGMLSLAAKKDDDLSETVKILNKNFSEAFKQQKSELASIKSEVSKILKKDIPILAGTTILGFVNPIAHFVGVAATAKDIIQVYKSYRNTKSNLKKEKKDFINLLIKARESKK